MIGPAIARALAAEREADISRRASARLVIPDLLPAASIVTGILLALAIGGS